VVSTKVGHGRLNAAPVSRNASSGPQRRPATPNRVSETFEKILATRGANVRHRPSQLSNTQLVIMTLQQNVLTLLLSRRMAESSFPYGSVYGIGSMILLARP
jgi:hypothetical protein